MSPDINTEQNMKTQILIKLLYISIVAALPVNNISENGINGINTIGNVAFAPATRSKDLYVLNDEGKPVKIDLNADDIETVEETRKNLHKRVFYYLYTRNIDRSNPTKLLLDDANGLRRSDFNPRRQTKIITHGWMNSRNSAACKLILDAYLRHGDYNVIVIDWSSISIRPYIWTTRRVLMISQYTSKMINFLENHGLDVSQLTIVGHSLGGHIAGLSARYARHQVNYVVSLDPALPNFATAGPGNRVSTGDARYVEIIHTNGGTLGFEAQIGDIDFYPNGGSQQAGCKVDIGGVCSHPRAYEYFAESINSAKSFLAARCNNFNDFKRGACKAPTAVMGGIAPNYKARGRYYLITNDKAPFARGVV